jgi:hypothetical protein
MWEGFQGDVLLSSFLEQFFEPQFLLLITVRMPGRINSAAGGRQDGCILNNFPFFWAVLQGRNQF